MTAYIHEWRRKRALRKVDENEVCELTGNYWSIVWRKLDISPCVIGSVFIGELSIRGEPAMPIVAQKGFVARMDVLEALERQLGVPEDEGDEFLICTLSGAQVISAIEEKMFDAES